MNISEGKLLLVEDDEAFAWAASRAMERRGYEVRHAGEFERARNLVEDEDFEYAVLDLNLGNCTSLDLILPLRERNPGMRILVLTGYASIATAVRAIKLGADNYLAKPADYRRDIDRPADRFGAGCGRRIATHVGAAPRMGTYPESARTKQWQHLGHRATTQHASPHLAAQIAEAARPALGCGLECNENDGFCDCAQNDGF